MRFEGQLICDKQEGFGFLSLCRNNPLIPRSCMDFQELLIPYTEGIFTFRVILICFYLNPWRVVLYVAAPRDALYLPNKTYAANYLPVGEKGNQTSVPRLGAFFLGVLTCSTSTFFPPASPQQLMISHMGMSSGEYQHLLFPRKKALVRLIAGAGLRTPIAE